MNQIIDAIAQDSGMIMALTLGPMAMVIGLLIAMTICRTVVRTSADKEQSRREIAAYVAEGSMSATDAEKLLNPRPWYASCSKWWGAESA